MAKTYAHKAKKDKWNITAALKTIIFAPKILSMGAYIIPLAYNHNLDITSDKKFAEDISKRFSANLTMLTDEGNDREKHEILFIKKEDAIRNISITKCSPSKTNAKLYIVNLLDCNNVFEVFPHHVDLYLMKTNVTRWCDIERAVRNKENLDLLHKFRLSMKIICNTLGCDICIYFSDEDGTEQLWEESLKNSDFNSIMEYVGKKRYIKSSCEEDVRGVLNLSEYLMNNQCVMNNWFYFMDVIVDDFKDLK